jgi:hypothetical protein
MKEMVIKGLETKINDQVKPSEQNDNGNSGMIEEY